MRALAITGPRAHPQHVAAFLQAAKEAKPAPVELSVAPAPSLQAARAQVAALRPDAVLVFGGDGTLNRHLPLLVDSGAPLLAVPSGSGNDFAMANGVFRWGDALRIWEAFLAGDAATIAADLGVCEFKNGESMNGERRCFSCCANIGLDADAAARANRLPAWLKSRGGYFLAGATAVLRYPMGDINISAVSGREAAASSAGQSSGNGIGNDSRRWLVSVSNTPTYGGGLKIAPQASIVDGLLDVTVVGALSRAALIWNFPKILTGGHRLVPGLETFAAQSLTVDAVPGSPVYADGEFFGHTPVKISIAPQSIRVLKIKSAPAV